MQLVGHAEPKRVPTRPSGRLALMIQPETAPQRQPLCVKRTLRRLQHARRAQRSAVCGVEGFGNRDGRFGSELCWPLLTRGQVGGLRAAAAPARHCTRVGAEQRGRQRPLQLKIAEVNGLRGHEER